MDNWTAAAQAGGAFAVVLGALAALGKGLAWLLNWHGERSDGKSARLAAWEGSLVAREKEYREGIEGHLEDLQREVSGLREDIGTLGVSLLEVTTELRILDPDSAALAGAGGALKRAFRPSFPLPRDMTALAQQLGDEPNANAEPRRSP